MRSIRYSLESVKILFQLGVGGWTGGKIIPRIRLSSAKVLVEVEAELGNNLLVIMYIRPGLLERDLYGGML